jgi:hypothetical protein
MGIAACIIRAVAVQKVCACRHTVVSRLVRKVAVVALSASSGAKESLTHGDLVRVVVEAALCTKGTVTCKRVRSGRGCLPTVDVSWWVDPVCSRGWLDDVVSMKYRS